MNYLRIALLACVFLSTAALSVSKIPPAQSLQPTGERKAQNQLPQVHDAFWDELGKCKLKLDSDKWIYTITLTPEVKALGGTQQTISGFMLPLEAKEKFSHFLLSKRTPTCPFCPPGEPNEIVEVFSKEPVSWEDGITVMSGNFVLVNNPDMGGLFFQLKDATDTPIHFQDKPAKVE